MRVCQVPLKGGASCPHLCQSARPRLDGAGRSCDLCRESDELSSPRCWPRPSRPCSGETIERFDAWRVWLPSPSDPARAASCSCAKPPTSACATPSTIGRASPCSTIQEAKRNMRLLCGSSRPRPRPWPRPPISRRSPHRRGLRHAQGQDHLRSEPCQPKSPKPRKTHLLNGGESPPKPFAALLEVSCDGR